MKKTSVKIVKILILAAFVTSVFAPTAILAQGPPQGPPTPVPDPEPIPPPPANPKISTPVNAVSCKTLNLFCHLTEFLKWTIIQIGYLIGLVVGLIITIGASVISFLIEINTGLPESLLVLTGFRITLSLTNLGFVLVLILIAFGTIFRVQSYQMKTTLRNLIIAAILVNFSLAIAGVIIDFTGVLSNFFINATTKSTSIPNFADSLANALSVQNLFTIAPAGVAGFFGSMITSLTGLVSAVLSLFLMIMIGILTAVTFWGIAIMIVIRYVYLTILLILMPLAWLFWVSPRLSHLFSDWWKKFIQWAFFLPAVTFFIYLTLFSVNEIGATIKSNAGKIDSITATNKLIFNKGGVEGALQSITIVGLLIGGVIAANSMGIKAGTGAINVAKGGKNWAVGKLKGGAKGIGRGAVRRTAGLTNIKRSAEGKSLAERTEGWASKTRTGPAAGIRRYLAGQVSRGVAGIAGVDTRQQGQRVKEADTKVAKMTDTQLMNSLTTGFQPTRVAALKRLTKEGKLDKVNMTRILTDDVKNTFSKLGEGKAFGDMEKAVGMNVAMMEALKANDQDAMNQAAQKFIKGLSDADKKKVKFDDMYKSESAYGLEEGTQKKMFQRAFTHGSMSVDPGMIAKAYPKMKSKNWDNFDSKIFESIADMDFPDKDATLNLYDLDALIKKSQSENRKEADTAKSRLMNLLKTANEKVYNSMTKNLANRATGMTFEPEAEGGAPTI